MIYAVKCINLQNCQEQARRYMEEYKLQIKEVRRHRPTPVIILQSGDEIHFLTHFTWDRWCKGLTYKFLGDDTLYHGKFPIKTQKTD